MQLPSRLLRRSVQRSGSTSFVYLTTNAGVSLRTAARASSEGFFSGEKINPQESGSRHSKQNHKAKTPTASEPAGAHVARAQAPSAAPLAARARRPRRQPSASSATSSATAGARPSGRSTSGGRERDDELGPRRARRWPPVAARARRARNRKLTEPRVRPRASARADATGARRLCRHLKPVAVQPRGAAKRTQRVPVARQPPREPPADCCWKPRAPRAFWANL